MRHPDGRRAIFLGDLVDRGPKIPATVTLVRQMVARGQALCVLGNHDVKLARYLHGKKVQVSHGLAESIAQIEALPEEERAPWRRDYLCRLPTTSSRIMCSRAAISSRRMRA